MTQAWPQPQIRHESLGKADPRTRYAIYFTPRPETPLWRFGCSILGYDSASGKDVAQPRLGMIAPARLAELTRRPRHYGFHATIKPPIRLAAGCDEAAFIAAFDAFCATCAPVTLAPLVVDELGEDGEASAFLALVEASPEPTPALRDLEARAVRTFEPLRAPMTQEEYARRNPETLPPRKRELLERYGYPTVLDAFTFHMTLSERVSGAERAALKAEFDALLRANMPRDRVTIDHLALCREIPGEPFRVLHRADFAAGHAL